MIALSDSSTITFSVVGLIIALAVLALLRIVLRNEAPAAWRRIRIGFFVERDPKGGDDDQEADR